MFSEWQSWLFVFGAAANTSLANMLIKESRLREHTPGIPGLFSPWFIGGLVFFGISVLLFSKALERLPVSLAYPAQAGCAFSMLVIISIVFLGEPISLVKLLGIGIIFAGILIAAH